MTEPAGHETGAMEAVIAKKRPPPKKRNPILSKAQRKELLETVGERSAWQPNSQHQDILRQVENPLFTKYYTEVNPLCSQAQWAKEMELFRKPLPTTVWINDTDEYASEARRAFESEADSLVQPIEWYPIPGMAWRILATRTEVRRDPSTMKLKKFLIQQTAMGIISRQEEVSMIPPFLLDIRPTDVCLDMCASPGSKTAQMLVALGRYKMVPFESDTSPFPFDYESAGLVMANELDTKRANMLVYQVKRMRLLFPFALFTNHDARYFPDIALNGSEPLFDKILCDVVCSGDGTLRKAPHMFRSWSPKEGMGLQKTQIQIALRGIHLLKVGGRLVYSTCTLNPIENEAVVAQLLRRTGGAVQLVDARSILPSLKSCEGLTTWRVMDGAGNVVSKPGPQFHPALFPPCDDLHTTAPGYDLRRCMRLLPSHVDGGAFFIAVLEKVKPFTMGAREHGDEAPDTETKLAGGSHVMPDSTEVRMPDTETESGRCAKRQRPDGAEVAGTPGSAPSVPEMKVVIPPQYVPATSSMVNCFNDFYGMKGFPSQNLIIRTAPGERESNLHSSKCSLVSKTALEVLQRRPENLVVVSAGLRVLAYDSMDSGWRITNEAAVLFAKLMQHSPRYIPVSSELFGRMLTAGGKLCVVPIRDIAESTHSRVAALSLGAVLLEVPCPASASGKGFAVALRTHHNLQLLVNHEDVTATHVRFGIPHAEVESSHPAEEAT